jgi:MSHA biogenesis protein MshL
MHQKTIPWLSLLFAIFSPVFSEESAPDRDDLLKEKREGHDIAIDKVIERSIYPNEPTQVRRNIFIFDEDVAAADRDALLEKLQSRLDVTSESESVRDIVRRLFATAGINYMFLDQAVGDELVTMHLIDETIDGALTALTKQVPIAFNYSHKIVYISRVTSVSGDVMVTEIIRLASGETDVTKRNPAVAQTRMSQSVPVFSPPQPPISLNGQNQNLAQTAVESDLELFIAKIPDIVVGWPAAGQVIHERKSNSLIVCATPAAIAEVKRLLRAIDYNSVQVLIEARFLEISESAVRELGIDWQSGFDGRHIDVTGATPTSGATITGGAAATGQSPASGLFAVVRGRNFGGFPDINAAVTALETSGKADTLAEPKILTLSGAEGLITVTQEVVYLAYITSQSPTMAAPNGAGTVLSNSSTVAAPQPMKAEQGIELRIQPSVAINSDTITLRLMPSVTELRRFFEYQFSYLPAPGGPVITQTAKVPEFDTRSLETIMHIKNGQTVALGGLTRERDQSDDAGLPFLSRVPLLGYIFGRKSRQHERRNLIILVTAHLVDPSGAHVGDTVETLSGEARVVLPEEVHAELDAAKSRRGTQWNKGRDER